MDFHYLHLFPLRSQLQEPACAINRATETRCFFKFFFTFGNATVIETKFFTEVNPFLCKHAYTIHLAVLFNFDYCLAIWTTAVTKP